MDLLIWILIGLVAGIIAELLLGGGPGGIGIAGLIVTAAVGVGGALLGGWLSRVLGYGDVTGFNLRSVIIATCGAILVIVLWRGLLMSGSRRTLL